MLQIGVCNIIHGNTNITNSCSDYHFLSMSKAFPLQNGIIIEHKDLIEKLSKDKDFVKFYKYSLAGSLQKSLVDDKVKTGVEVPNEDKVTLEEITNEAKGSYEKVVNKFPDFKSLDINEKTYVLKESFAVAGLLAYTEVMSCSYTAYETAIGGCTRLTQFERALFFSCLGIAFGADIIALIDSAGAATPEVASVTTYEFQSCAAFAKDTAWAGCIAFTVGTLIQCIRSNAKQ